MGRLWRRQHGFTLLELMGVLAILMVLVVAVVISLVGFSGRRRQGELQYRREHYPDGGGDLLHRQAPV